LNIPTLDMKNHVSRTNCPNLSSIQWLTKQESQSSPDDLDKKITGWRLKQENWLRH